MGRNEATTWSHGGFTAPQVQTAVWQKHCGHVVQRRQTVGGESVCVNRSFSPRLNNLLCGVCLIMRIIIILRMKLSQFSADASEPSSDREADCDENRWRCSELWTEPSCSWTGLKSDRAKSCGSNIKLTEYSTTTVKITDHHYQSVCVILKLFCYFKGENQQTQLFSSVSVKLG